MRKSYTIVVADDDMDDHYLFVEATRKINAHFELRPVYNGLELLHLLKKGVYRPDMIVLDLNMPLLDGFGVLTEIKEDPSMKDIPVYVLSTTRDETEALRTHILGASHFYSKPEKIGSLRQIIEEMLCDLDNQEQHRAN